MKLILCTRRHQNLDRVQFLHHLGNVHGPLIRSLPACTKYIRKYVQNPTRLPEDGVSTTTAFRHGTDRDAVSELWFDSQQDMMQALGEPTYHSIVRPDEESFNDLSQLIILATKELPLKVGGTGGPCIYKTFDYIKRRADIDEKTFHKHWERHADLLLSSDVYQRCVWKSVRNMVLPQEENPFGASAAYDGVVETWFTSFEDADRLGKWHADNQAILDSESEFIDASHSFSVVAEERTVIG